jgi:hypothetical protein
MTARVFIVQFVSGQRWLALSFDGIRDGIRQPSKVVYRHTPLMGGEMALTDTFIRTVKPNGKPAAKYTDRDGVYLLVTSAGKYWRMDYRFLGKRKTLALGASPETSLAKARGRCSEARTMLADGLDPGDEKRKAKQAKLARAAHTFEQVAELWLDKTASSRAATTQEKVHGYLKGNIFPMVGEQLAFAHAALALKYDPETEVAPITEQQILQPKRREDVGNDLWKTFNRVQERMLKGGVAGRSATGKRTTTRAITGIDQDFRLNRALWVLAEQMKVLKG